MFLGRLIDLVSRSKGSFSFRTFVVLLGAMFGQGIGFLALPLITLLYDPSELGNAATTIALVGVGVLAVSFQYDQAIIVADDKELPYLMVLSAGLSVLVSTLLLLILILIQQIRPQWLELLGIYGYNFLLPPLLGIYALFLTLIGFHLRQNRVMTVSVGRIIYFGGTAVTQIAVGYLFGGTAFVYLVAQTGAAFIATICLFPFQKCIRWIRTQSLEELLTQIKIVARRHKRFPIYQLPSQSLNALSIHAPVIFLRVIFSESWAAWYFVAYRLVSAPIGLLLQAVGQIFYRDSAEREREGFGQALIIERMVIELVRISLLPLLIFGVTAPLWVEMFFDETYAPVAHIVRIMLFASIITFCTSPLSAFVNVKNKQREALPYYLSIVVFRMGILFIAWWVGGEWFTIIGYSFVSMVVFIPFLFFLVHSGGGKMRNIADYLRPTVLLALSILAVFVLIRMLSPNWLIAGYIITLFLVTGGLYYDYRRPTYATTSL